MIRSLSITAALLLTAGVAHAAELPLPQEPLPPFAVAQYDATPTPTPDATPAMTPNEMSSPTPTPTPVAAPAGVVTTGATKLKLGGVLYALYSYDLSKGPDGKSLGNKDQFDVSRAYVNVEPSWGDDYFGRMTIDVTRATTTSAGNASVNTTGSLVERLKYGYFGADVLKTGPVTVSARAGLQQTPFVDFEEDVWKYRVLAPVMADAFFGMSSSDFGFATYGKVLGRVDYYTGVYNGESYQKPEANKYKEIDSRVTVQILPADKDPGLRFSVYYGYGIKGPKQDSDKVRGVAMLSYQSSLFTAAAEYLYAQDGAGGGAKHVIGAGESVFAFVNLPLVPPKMVGSRLVARIDLIDPNTDGKVKKDGTTRIIGGIALRYTDKTQVVLDYQQTSPEDSAKKPTQGAFAHWEAKF